jgi:apolipoprotein N-acyltransferase
MLKKASNFLLVLLSGLLLGLSWYTSFTLLIFIGFVPLFLAVNNIHNSDSKKKGLRIWAFTYLAFFIWNIVSTWWVYNASLEGAILAIVCNALLHSWMFGIWYRTEKRIFGSLKFWLLIPIWLAYEYLHHCWELTWPWLTLGNCFATKTNFVQWYEFTGTSGGSLWVLVVNILLTQIVLAGKKDLKSYLKPLAVILVPILVSFLILSIRSVTTDKKINVTVIQPNIDPYNEKFDVPFQMQLEKLHGQLLKSKLNKETQLVVFPETFVVGEGGGDVNENFYAMSMEANSLKDLVKFHFPKASILAGANTLKDIPDGEKITPTARKYGNVDKYYDSYNTAVYYDSTKQYSYYHKSKLVPGVERMPYPGFFKYFEKYAIALGGTSGSLGTQKERTVFEDKVYGAKIAPCICYESVYGDFMGEYVRKGAQAICITTNDGWWGNTPGHRQHLAYAKLRAIETRKQIIRSANTGISCFIDEFGNISQPQPYWEFGVINADVNLNSEKTFFVRCGDLISYASVLLAVIVVIYGRIKRRVLKVEQSLDNP